MSDLRQYDTSKAHVDQLRLTMIQPENKGKVIIWVEGNDANLYGELLNQDKVIIRGGIGCIQVEKDYREFKSEYPNKKSIVIRDADFLRVDGNLSQDANFIYTDGHDIEMMMLKNDVVKRRILGSMNTSFDIEQLYNSIFSDLRILSFFKWYNMHFDCRYNFRPINIEKTSSANLQNPNWMKDQLPLCLRASHCDNECEFNEISPESVNEFMQEHNDTDIYEITNGHDFLQRLAKYINGRKGKEYARSEGQLRDFAVNIFSDHYKESKLYASLLNWCKSNNVNIIKMC